ncbi:MAG TPA: methyltransferase domain-containing protein [Bryobacteraceae bacterium]|nr:methyltransferase domain-containing protein [Bryobacteraceae bacterium]
MSSDVAQTLLSAVSTLMSKLFGGLPIPIHSGSLHAFAGTVRASKSVDMSVDAANKSVCATSAFDGVASQYDRQWTDAPIGLAQRELVWRFVDPLFHTGDRILDVGCGTGADAAHLSRRGAIVHATDPSPAMIEIARERGGFTTAVLPAEQIASVGGIFDGAISNFGALNCLDDLASFARALATRVRPGGYVAICTIGKFCLWEFLYYTTHGKFAKGLRRLRGTAPSSLGVTVRYPSIVALREAFEDFQLVRWTGIGLFVPPSYVRMRGGIVRWCSFLDRALARLPLLRALADHRLLILVRK